jgi:hypothetical protein
MRTEKTRADTTNEKEIAMHRTPLALLALASLMLMTGSGCRPTTLGANTGVAYGLAKQGQILNPDAGENLEPVVGMEGVVAETAMEQYRKSFEKQEEGLGKSVVTTGVQTK